MENIDNQNIQPQNPEKEKRKMKKGWKIALISFLSLLGLVILAVIIALWLILTPARLTSIVNKLSDKYILCESNFEKVDLTVFKTFPYVGLSVEGVNIINPIVGAPSDTLASVKELCVGINLHEYLKHKNIEVTKLILDGTTANLYIGDSGITNFDIFPSSGEEDTTTSEPFQMPELVSLESIRVKHLSATYVDSQSAIKASLDNAKISVDGCYKEDQNHGDETLLSKIDAKVRMEVDGVAFIMEGDSSSVDAQLKDLALKLDGASKGDNFEGEVQFYVKNGKITLDDVQYINESVELRKGRLLSVESHLAGNLSDARLVIDGLKASLKDYSLNVNGTVSMPLNDRPTTIDLSFATNEWGVKELLAMLPQQFVEWQKGMDLDANAELTGTAKGELSDNKMPIITADLKLKDGKFRDKTLLPYDLRDITVDLSANLDLNEKGISDVDITKISARTGRNNIEVNGHIADLMGKMNTDATVKGLVYLADLKPMLPDDLNMKLEGNAKLNLKAHTNLEQLQKSDFANMSLNGDVLLSNLDVEYDTIFAKIPQAKVNIQFPSKMKKGLFNEMLSLVVDATSIDANLPNEKIEGNIGKTKLQVAVNDIFDTTQPFRMVCDYDFASLSGMLDTIKASISEPKGTFAMVPKSKTSDIVKYTVNLGCNDLHCELSDSSKIDLAGLSVNGDANYDPSKEGTLQQWSPNIDIDFKRGYIDMEQIDYVVQIPDIKFNYKPEKCDIASANIVFGNSDFYLSGSVTGLEKWLVHQEMLKGDLYFTSNYTNVDNLLDVFSGMGTDADTLEAQRREDNVDTSANPFIVPKDVDFTLHTRIKEATAFDNDLREVAGDIQIRDGIAVLNQVGFVCKAARMQLTGLYKTPRVNHIFVGMDFHLLDINIQELIDMIPYVDTLVPILADLEGAADFHLCAETYVNAFYKPKMSTLRAAAALTGQDLVVLDNKDIDRIAKLLQLKSWREDDSKIHVDSLDVAMTVFRKELEVYPFLLSLHKYQIVAEGRHDLNNNYDYHVELVQSPLPVRLAVDVLGTMPKLKFEMSPKLRYKNLYRPARRTEVDEQMLRLKAMIRQSLEANVKQETRDYEGL